MSEKNSVNDVLVNIAIIFFIIAGFAFCFFGLDHKDTDYITVGVTIILATITGHYAYSTKKILNVNEGYLKNLEISNKKPKIENIANTFLQPILKYSESGLVTIQKNLPIVRVHPINNNNFTRMDSFGSSLNVFDKLIFELTDPFIKILEYQILKKTQNIDPSYPDLTFKNNFPIFESEIGKIIEILDKINKKIMEFGLNESSNIDIKCNFEDFTSKFDDIYEIKLSSKNYLLSKLFNEIFLCNYSISIYYLEGESKDPVPLNNKQAEYYLFIEEIYQKYYNENESRFVKEKEEFILLLSNLEISLEKVTSQLNEWLNDWINEFHIVIEKR